MRDLELRGAGNLLGAEQHGHLQEIGYDYYCKLMEEAVRELKGEKLPAADFETNIDLSIDAFIPNEYIPAENQKMNAYRRIASIETPEDASDVTDELMDRYGDPPTPVRNLLEVAQLKALAHDAWVTDLTGGAQELRFTMHKDAPADTDGLAAWMESEGLDPSGYDASADYDGDGSSNYAEYAAGTDPFDENDLLRITAFSKTPENEGGLPVLSFEYSGGRIYCVASSTNLAPTAGWERVPHYYEASTNDPHSAFVSAQDDIGVKTLYLAPAAKSQFFVIRVNPEE